MVRNAFILFIISFVALACGDGASYEFESQNPQLFSAGEITLDFTQNNQNSIQLQMRRIPGAIQTTAAAAPVVSVFPPPINNANQYFTVSSANAAYYEHVDSVDFDLVLKYVGSNIPQMTCRMEFPVIQPLGAQVTNADGVTSQGYSYIHLGRFRNSMTGREKNRRVELSTNQTGAVSISFNVFCIWDLVLTNRRPLMIEVIPSIASENDVVSIKGEGFRTNSQVFLNQTALTVLNATNSQLDVLIPQGVTTGPLEVRNTFGATVYTDTMGTFRIDSIADESITKIPALPTTGMLVTSFYPRGTVNQLTGCPSASPVYQLFTFDVDLSTGVLANESERVPAGTWDSLTWLDPNCVQGQGCVGSIKPLAGYLKENNLSNTVTVGANQRFLISHLFNSTYTSNCP